MIIQSSKKLSRGQKGIALLWVVFIAMLLTSITVTIVYILVKEIRMGGSIEDSVRAYYAAEAGLDKGLRIVADTAPNYPSSITNCPVVSSLVPYPYPDVSNLSFTLSFCKKDIDGNEFLNENDYVLITSEGISNNIHRKVEIKFNAQTPDYLFTYDPCPDTVLPEQGEPQCGDACLSSPGKAGRHPILKPPIDDNDKKACKNSKKEGVSLGNQNFTQSFNLKFPIFGGPDPSTSSFEVGLVYSNGEGRGVKGSHATTTFYRDEVFLDIEDKKSGNLDSEKASIPGGFNSTATYKVRIQYIKGVAFRLTIKDENDQCITSTTIIIDSSKGEFEFTKIFFRADGPGGNVDWDYNLDQKSGSIFIDGYARAYIDNMAIEVD